MHINATYILFEFEFFHIIKLKAMSKASSASTIATKREKVFLKQLKP